MSRKHWVLKPLSDESLASELSAALNDLPLPLARSLVLRGISTFDDARSFFRDAMDRLADPFLMNGMAVAADRVVAALESGEKIVVYGDYDVDGTSATALLTGFLSRIGADVDFFVPDRFEHGYGLSRAGLDRVREMGASLIIAVDCGVTATDEAAYAAEHGIELIVCDHHTPPETLPDVVAVLDPKRSDCAYPFDELCGCGVAFKLAQAVNARLEEQKDSEGGPANNRAGEAGNGAGAASNGAGAASNGAGAASNGAGAANNKTGAAGNGAGAANGALHEYLDLVAMATASDLVSLKGENRILVREGLRHIRSGRRIGLKALAEEAGIKLSDCSSASIVYTLSPRINAAGRMGDAARAVSLLLADDELEAMARARQLENVNNERRTKDRETQEEAAKKASALLSGEPRNSVVLYDPDWHIGVIGIVASRLVDLFYRPTVLLAEMNGVAKGSARSIDGVSVYEAIKSCEDLLLEFGGHDGAAGLSLRPDDIPEFSRRFDKAVAEQISAEMLEPAVQYDASMAIGDLTRKFWAVLKQFAPFGADNQPPLFHAEDLRVAGPISTVGRDRSHLKFSVTDARGEAREIGVIGFRMSKKYLEVVTKSQSDDLPLEMLFQIQENTWNGRTTLQLKARDIRLQADQW